MIHAFQNRGECELLAVTITKDHEEVAPYVDAINSFYGRGDIPIGIVNGASPEGRHTHLKLDPMNIPRIQELMAALVSEPPQSP